jgi:SP family myo-inositol transporter-like MFS transporter 13
MVLQQWCGVNAVLYYAASIYEMAGFNQIVSIWLSAFTSLAQIFGLALSVLLVEKAGRRPLILSSLGLVSASVVVLGYSFYLARVDSDPVSMSVQGCEAQQAWGWSGQTQYCFDCVKIDGCGFCDGMCLPGDSDTCPDPSLHAKSCSNPYGYLAMIFMVVFLVTFGVGLAGLPWTVNSEIYPIQYRSLAVSLSTATNWLCNLVISSTFLTLSNRLMIHRAFWLYGILSGIGWVWLYFILPETKGRSMEEIQDAFAGKHTEHHERQMLLTKTNKDTTSNITYDTMA